LLFLLGEMNGTVPQTPIHKPAPRYFPSFKIMADQNVVTLHNDDYSTPYVRPT
jgi:hypothetical protein